MLSAMSDVIVGIDLGTTYSAIGVMDSGFPILLANEEGKRITPSAVWIGPGGETEVGATALRRRGVDPVITSVKRLMGRRFGEVEDFPLPVEQGEQGELRVMGRTPEEVSALILGELVRIAEWRLECEVNKAVITVPAYFHESQRAATKRAGELAGLEVVRIVNEPTAAALAYGLDKLGEHARVAVYDFGGGTFDLTVLEMEEGVFQVRATHGDTRLGGDDLDEALWGYVAEQVGFADEPGAREFAEAERVKRALSESGSETFRLPFSEQGNIELEITREAFEKVARSSVARTIDCARRAMSDAKMEVGDLDAVVLVGGSSRIPLVRQQVAEFFGCEPDLSQHPDEAIALGATLQAGVLSGAVRDMVLLDVTPLSLGLETFGGLMNVLIPRNTTIPCKAGEVFTNAVADQRSMRVRVLQGEREMARDNWPLGEFEVGFDPAPKGQARVGVQFRINENGMLEVLARDLATSKDTVVNIDSAAVDVDDERVEQMVSESVEHAFEDMSERVFTEAKLKAEELLKAVDSILEAQAALVSDEERRDIEAKRGEVEAGIKSGEANPLKQAVQALDHATEAVAARMVEKAMEEAMERKLM